MPEFRKQRHFSGLILFLLLAAAAGFFILQTVNSGLVLKRASLEKALQYLKSEYVFGKIEPLGRESYRLTLYNIEGKTVSVKTLNVPGGDLYIESRVAVIEYNEEERAFVFPLKAYSDTVPEKDGIDLKPLYMKNGYPAIYTVSSNDEVFVSVVREIYRQSETAAGTGDGTNNAVPAGHLKIKLAMDVALHRGPFQSGGKTVELLVHPDGGLEERED